jgi:hypothetical protein
MITGEWFFERQEYMDKNNQPRQAQQAADQGMIGGSNKNVSMNRRAALLGNTAAAAAEPKVEEKKVSPEMSQEERRRLAIQRLAPKNPEDYKKIFHEWLASYFEDRLQAFEKFDRYPKDLFYVNWTNEIAGKEEDSRTYLSADVEGIMTHSILKSCDVLKCYKCKDE